MDWLVSRIESEEMEVDPDAAAAIAESIADAPAASSSEPAAVAKSYKCNECVFIIVGIEFESRSKGELCKIDKIDEFFETNVGSNAIGNVPSNPNNFELRQNHGWRTCHVVPRR